MFVNEDYKPELGELAHHGVKRIKDGEATVHDLLAQYGRLRPLDIAAVALLTAQGKGK